MAGVAEISEYTRYFSYSEMVVFLPSTPLIAVPLELFPSILKEKPDTNDGRNGCTDHS